MKTKIRTLIVLCMAMSLILFASSCAKKQVAAPTGPTPEEIAAAERAAEAERDRLAREQAERERAAQEERDRLAQQQEQAERERLERERQEAQREMREFESENIYFDYDMSELKPEAKATLTDKANYLKKNPQYKVRIDGHCDERGTNEYNIALGEKRANAAKKFITALGVSADRITTRSYGEEKPADSGHNEAAWAKNRRDEFKLID